MQPQHVCQFSSTACSSMLFPTQLALLLALPLCECFGVPPQATVVDEVMFDNVSDLSAGSDASQRTQRSAGTYYYVHSGQYCAQRGSKRPSTCGYQTNSGGYCAGRTGKTRRPWASYRRSSQSECKQACDAAEDCNAFDWSPWHGDCALIVGGHTCTATTPHSEWNSYWPAPCSISRQACQDACNSAGFCSAFDWSPHHNDCFLIKQCSSTTAHGEWNSYWSNVPIRAAYTSIYEACEEAYFSNLRWTHWYVKRGCKAFVGKVYPGVGTSEGRYELGSDYDVSSCIDRCNIEVYPNDPDDPNDDKRIQRTRCRHGCTIMGC